MITPSSAKNGAEGKLGLDCQLSDGRRLLMNLLKRIGDKGDPCNSPQLRFCGADCSKYGYGAQSILLCGEYYASARGLRCTLSEEELCGRRADW